MVANVATLNPQPVTIKPVEPSDESKAAIEAGHFGKPMEFLEGGGSDAVNMIAALRKEAPGLASRVADYHRECFASVSGGSEEERRARAARFQAEQRAAFEQKRDAAMAKADEEATALTREWRDQMKRDVASDPMCQAVIQRLIIRGASPDELKQWRQSGDLAVKMALAAAPPEVTGLAPEIRDLVDTELRKTLRPDIVRKADTLAERVRQLEVMDKGFNRLLGRTMEPGAEAHWAAVAEKENIR